MERTFVMVKPDGVARGLIGEVVARMERKGLKLVGAKMLRPSRELAEKQYEEHRNKPFFSQLVSFTTSGPVLAMVVEGRGAVRVMRKLIGATDPKDASPGSVRGDLALDIGRNVVHASDSRSTSRREIELYFGEDEIHSYSLASEEWLYE